MKKIYQTPKTVIVKIQAARMIAASKETIPQGEDYNNEVILSRETKGGRSVWDDEDDDYGY